MNFQIKAFKEWNTYDGGGYQFNLYLDNKKFAFVHNDGNGGMIDIHFADANYPHNHDTPNAKVWREYVKSFGQWHCLDRMIDHDTDTIVDKLVNKYEMDKQRKKGLLFRLVTDSELSYRTIMTQDVELAKRQLAKKFGEDNFIFI
jgi:N-acyl-D-aspartate/D-glutamate deacylase